MSQRSVSDPEHHFGVGVSREANPKIVEMVQLCFIFFTHLLENIFSKFPMGGGGLKIFKVDNLCLFFFFARTPKNV